MKAKKNTIKCLKCDDRYIDCRDYIFCMAEEMKYVGRKKDYETPKWCPKLEIPGWNIGKGG